VTLKLAETSVVSPARD